MPHLFDAYYPWPVSEWEIRQNASKFDVSYKAALRMKLRFAAEAAQVWIEVFEPMAWRWLENIIKLQQMIARADIKLPANEVTDAMIEQARERDIRSVVDFSKGKATAWCHEDKNPSLTYMSRTNTAWCASCGKYFDSIGVLMNRDGLSFRSAVRELCK